MKEHHTTEEHHTTGEREHHTTGEERTSHNRGRENITQ
jgi:hypothetical protein